MSLGSCSEGLVRMIPPANITDSSLLSSNVPENDYPLYSASVSYVNGAQVIANHRIYQNNSGGALIGVYPPDNLTQWEDKGPSNRWRMFDLYNTTVTQNPSSIIVEIKTGVAINSLALLNLRGSYVDVIATHPINGEVFRKRYTLRNSTGIRGWYTYFFLKRNPKYTITELEIPAFRNVTMRIEIHAPGGTAQCGSLLLGRQIVIGQLQWGYSPELNDYSSKNIDTNGYVTINQRGYSFRPEFSMQIEDNMLDTVAEIMARHRSTPCVWVIGTRHRVMTVFGFYLSFRPVVNHGLFSECSLQIEGFI